MNPTSIWDILDCSDTEPQTPATSVDLELTQFYPSESATL
jgi:hypothetical protein